jgi:Integrase core domain
VKAEENGYAERWMRTLKEEEVDLSEYRDFYEARQQIGHFIEDVYNRKRIHSALGYLTPLESELVSELSSGPGSPPLGGIKSVQSSGSTTELSKQGYKLPPSKWGQIPAKTGQISS